MEASQPLEPVLCRTVDLSPRRVALPADPRSDLPIVPGDRVRRADADCRSLP
jgi:hypothetical protein